MSDPDREYEEFRIVTADGAVVNSATRKFYSNAVIACRASDLRAPDRAPHRIEGARKHITWEPVG